MSDGGALGLVEVSFQPSPWHPGYTSTHNGTHNGTLDTSTAQAQHEALLRLHQAQEQGAEQHMHTLGFALLAACAFLLCLAAVIRYKVMVMRAVQRRQRMLEAAARERDRVPHSAPLPARIRMSLHREAYTADMELLDKTCSICLEEYEQQEEVTILPCSHSFHSDCVDAWFCKHSTCPMCRSSLKDSASTKAKLTRLNQFHLRLPPIKESPSEVDAAEEGELRRHTSINMEGEATAESGSHDERMSSGRVLLEEDASDGVNDMGSEDSRVETGSRVEV